jgi:DNA repair protein RecO (recombination protein O)
MASLRDRALCLRKTEYSETSQILTLFGRDHGVVRVIAKGAHRRTKAGNSKFDGGIDLLDEGDGVYLDRAGRDLATLIEWKLLDGHLGLRRSLSGVLLGQAAVEVLAHLLPERDPYPALFDRAAATLPQLAGPGGEVHFLALLIDAVEQTGYLPDFDAAGPTRAWAGKVAATLRGLPRLDGVVQRLPKLTRQQVVPLVDLLFDHVRQITDRPLLTRPFLPA